LATKYPTICALSLRVRLALEGGGANAKTLEELQLVTDRLAALPGTDDYNDPPAHRGNLICGRLGGRNDVPLANLVREVGDLYEPIAEDKHIVLRVISKDGATVRGDHDRLLESVANLVDNSLKFTPTGVVEVALVLARTKASFECRTRDLAYRK
jgi:hypothetical protein